MSMITTIGAIIIVLIAVILILAAMKPAAFRVERSAVLSAPADKIFPLINDFRRWVAWSPYETIDSDLKRTHSGAQSGKGAVYAWQGRTSGSGRMEITDATAPSRILIKLDFFRPFNASNTAEYTMEPVGDGTRVTWAMYGKTIFIGKLMSVFMNTDRMLGSQFEAGLAKLKAVAER